MSLRPQLSQILGSLVLWCWKIELFVLLYLFHSILRLFCLLFAVLESCGIRLAFKT